MFTSGDTSSWLHAHKVFYSKLLNKLLFIIIPIKLASYRVILRRDELFTEKSDKQNITNQESTYCIKHEFSANITCIILPTSEYNTLITITKKIDLNVQVRSAK